MNATMNATLNSLRDWLAIAEDAVTTNTPRVFNAAMQEIATRALAAAMQNPQRPASLETAFRSAAGLGHAVTNLPLTPVEAEVFAGRIVSRPAFRSPSPSLQVSSAR